MKFSRVLLLFGVLTACVSVQNQPIFRIEPNRGVTFGHHGALDPESRIEIQVDSLAESDVFLISRCGQVEDCSASRTVSITRGRQTPSRDFVFEAEDGGRYYFWVQRRYEGGETGPVAIASFSADALSFSAKFTSGATVQGTLQGAAPPYDP